MSLPPGVGLTALTSHMTSWRAKAKDCALKGMKGNSKAPATRNLQVYATVVETKASAFLYSLGVIPFIRLNTRLK